MNRQLVNSSSIRSVGYDAVLRLLEIEFHSGNIYQYYSVPESCYSELMSAPSKGTYFTQHIRDVFEYTRVA
jgi:hypothetical protein